VELDAELAEARSWSDSSRTATLAAERGMLLDEVAAATGLSGRLRTSGGSAERARVAVKKAIASAITAITEVDPALGRLLRDTIRTGASCCYAPDPSRPVRWVLTDAPGAVRTPP
jgi:3-oxoacyl-ACP reductase-like protein